MCALADRIATPSPTNLGSAPGAHTLTATSRRRALRTSLHPSPAESPVYVVAHPLREPSPSPLRRLAAPGHQRRRLSVPGHQRRAQLQLLVQLQWGLRAAAQWFPCAHGVESLRAPGQWRQNWVSPLAHMHSNSIREALLLHSDCPYVRGKYSWS